MRSRARRRRRRRVVVAVLTAAFVGLPNPLSPPTVTTVSFMTRARPPEERPARVLAAQQVVSPPSPVPAPRPSTPAPSPVTRPPSPRPSAVVEVPPSPAPRFVPRAPEDTVVVAAGDIACDPLNSSYKNGLGTARACRQHHTAEVVRALAPDAVLGVGDLQYDAGELPNFRESYERSWGAFRARTYPAPGNHEYYSPGAAGYFDYFGAVAGDRSKGYYSFDVGTWHVVALNSNCGAIGGCQAGSAQEQWLRADLSAHAARCTMAFWHHPRFSSGEYGNKPGYDAFWRALYEAGADVVVNGHEHDYERFAPQTPDAERNEEAGIREFVVGTGGRSLQRFGEIQPASEVRQNTAFGVLELRLGADGYDWRFIAEGTSSFSDSGSGKCH